MMKYARISLGGLLVVVCFSALGLAALRTHTLLWAQIIYTIAPTSLFIATIGAIVGRHRAFWIGAAVLGWGYWMLVFGPWFWLYAKPWLLSTRILEEAFDRLIAPGLLRQRFPGRADILVTSIDWSDDIDRKYFLQIGHGISVLIHMVEGGIVGIFLDRNRQRRNESGMETP